MNQYPNHVLKRILKEKDLQDGSSPYRSTFVNSTSKDADASNTYDLETPASTDCRRKTGASSPLAERWLPGHSGDSSAGKGQQREVESRQNSRLENVVEIVDE